MTRKCLPNRYTWNRWIPNTIARSSHSMQPYRFSASVSDFRSIIAAPRPLMLASTSNTGWSVCQSTRVRIQLLLSPLRFQSISGDFHPTWMERDLLSCDAALWLFQRGLGWMGIDSSRTRGMIAASSWTLVVASTSNEWFSEDLGAPFHMCRSCQEGYRTCFYLAFFRVKH